MGTSLVVQWLRLYFWCRGLGFQGTQLKIIIIIMGQTDLMCPLICGTEKDLCRIYVVLCSIYVVLLPKI